MLYLWLLYSNIIRIALILKTLRSYEMVLKTSFLINAHFSSKQVLLECKHQKSHVFVFLFRLLEHPQFKNSIFIFCCILALNFVQLEMGNCLGSKPNTLSYEYMQQIRSIISDGQFHILHLMYVDLAERIADRKINMENFLLFFHKNGFWGERLFREFDYDETELISEEQFIRGIAQIFKSTQKEKISLLFKFFAKGSSDQNEGVLFNDFLIMLYNYPKEDLKEILNDKEFIELQLKKYLIPSETGRKSDAASYQFESFESTYHVKQYLMPLKQSEKRVFSSVKSSDKTQQDYMIPSMIGKQMIKNLKNMQKVQDTVIRLKDGDNFIDIKTMNIQQLVKKFAQSIFRKAKVDIQRGKLNFNQFFDWISVHKALYENYYDGFHNQVWQTDLRTKKPKYLISQCEKASDAKACYNKTLINVKLILLNSILILCQINNVESPIMAICLEGLAVRRIFERETGFGIEISHRDGVYPEKKIFFKNQQLLLEWMDFLKYYKGESIQKRYDIGEKIGTGKFSVVYKSLNFSDSKEYALKEIATFKLEPQAKNLIAHESSIMQIVSHPLLLEFKECIQTKTHIYIITELVKGRDLFEFVKEYDFLDEYDAAKICQQIIVGVRFLHSLEIVHRDLKPENIMAVLDEESKQIANIKIIDFGFNQISRMYTLSDQELLAGTPNYIAPEVLREEKFQFKIDNFAIGVILYFMLTGTLPFNDYTITQILQNTMKGEYKYSDAVIVSNEAKNLIDLLLKNNPNERISLDDALKHDWFKILSNPRKKQRKGARNNKKYSFLL